MRPILYLAHEKLADSDLVIIPYKVISRLYTTLYGIIIGSLYAYFSRARYKRDRISLTVIYAEMLIRNQVTKLKNKILVTNLSATL